MIPGGQQNRPLVPLAGSIAGNAVISMAENAANQIIENKGFKDFDVGDMVFDGAVGAVSGAIGGPGKGSKHLTNLGKQTVKRTMNAISNKGVKAGIKEAGKAFRYYSKNTSSYYKRFFKESWIDILSTIGSNVATSNKSKRQLILASIRRSN